MGIDWEEYSECYECKDEVPTYTGKLFKSKLGGHYFICDQCLLEKRIVEATK